MRIRANQTKGEENDIILVELEEKVQEKDKKKKRTVICTFEIYRKLWCDFRVKVNSSITKSKGKGNKKFASKCILCVRSVHS